ncbi:MAG: ABC transporter permease [Desulfobacterales bacterium]|nr:ABC transporter permease [Desulfobacterales bacterium]
MPGYLLKRLAHSLFALWGVITLVFFILHLSGDPALLLAPEGAGAEDIALIRTQLGLDRPLIIQYGAYLRDLARWDLGTSYAQSLPVSEIIASRAPYTLHLALAALMVAIIVGVPVGILTGVYRGRWIERMLMPLVLVGQSMPTFWSGVLLIMLFAVTLEIMPSSGSEGPLSVIMPAVSLGALSMATFARILRAGVVEEMGKEYVRAARAKGLSFGRILYRHILRNASIPLITIASLEFAMLLAGAVIVETVFAWPGLGQLAVQAIEARDFLVVQALVLLGSLVYIILNFMADVLYSIVDPRIQLERPGS